MRKIDLQVLMDGLYETGDFSWHVDCGLIPGHGDTSPV